jgi:phosphatidylglycerol lysyltransferase
VTDRVRELVLRYGWNATSYQILNPGFSYWFSGSAPAVVGYTRRRRVLLTGGAPVCSTGALRDVCAEFEEFARGLRCRVCYVCAEDRLRDILTTSGTHSFAALGAQPAWAPKEWPSVVEGHSSLRAQLSRARNKGVSVDRVVSVSDEMRQVLREWIRNRLLPPLHFLVEPEILDAFLADRLLLVARRGGRPIALALASPIPARQGYLLEILARSGSAPNGTSELLIDAVMQHAAASNCAYVTLGLVALATAAGAHIEQNPFWLRAMMRFARAHANRFYNFQGLEQFRTKMAPVRWETVYAISSEPRFSPRTMYAIGEAFSGIAPWRALAIGARRAIRQEFSRLNRGPRTASSSPSP